MCGFSVHLLVHVGASNCEVSPFENNLQLGIIDVLFPLMLTYPVISGVCQRLCTQCIGLSNER